MVLDHSGVSDFMVNHSGMGIVGCRQTADGVEKEMKPISNLTLEEIDQRIERTAVEAAIEIGFWLKQIRDRKLYKQAGCRDVYEYARKQYGYDKSVASRHMSRNDRFSEGGNSPELAEKYRGYGKSQLQEMISMTEEQLEQAKPEMTVREMKDLKKKSEKAAKPEPVATSQQDEKNSCPPNSPGCRRQEWGLSAAQQKQGKKECGECWAHWKQLHPEKQPKQEEKKPEVLPGKKQEFSAYGLPALEYSSDSLLTGAGCGEYGGVLYDCFSCHMNNCQIRQEECHCVGAPLGKPFPCRTLILIEQEQVRRTIGDHPCQFLDHDLADHRAGDGSAVLCCKNCDTPCAYQCDRAAAVREKEEEPEERVIDGDCREVEDQTEGDRYEETSEKTDRELVQGMLDREKQTLKQVLEAFMENDEYARKQKILVAALAGYICDLDMLEGQEENVQPDLPVLRNNDQRKAWLRNYKDWGLWYRDDNIGAEYYKYDFSNGARLIAEVYREPATKYISAYDSCHLHLIGGPEPPRNGSLKKWTRHEKYSRYPNSDTELVEFLKEVQRGRK